MRVSTLAFVIAVMGLAGCADPQSDPGDVEASASALSEGSPEAIGLLAFLNAPATTVTVLDVDAALDARAAKGLIAHRDGVDRKGGTADDNRFDTIAEVDGVAYVGTSALEALLAYARKHGFVPAGAETLGTYDSVLFTVAEGTATLALANTATSDHLDKDLRLDSRAVKSILKARPIPSVLALSKLAYVGTAALKTLKQAALTPVVPPRPAGIDVAAHLATASQGLLHTSESDHPFTVVRVPGGGHAPLTLANVKAVLASVYQNRPEEPTLAERDAELVSLASFFDRYVVPQDWWEDFQTQQAPAFQALEKVLQSELIDVQVFRFGTRQGNYLEGAIDVFIIGVTEDGEVVGLSTISVET